ncbi:hypothetical protein ACTPEM_25625, partial [Clostridioides difficile]
SYLKSLYERIVSISSIRSTIINGFVGVISASWVIAMFAIFFRNKYSLLRNFTKLKGITPYRYLENIRVNKAKKLLEKGVEPIDA